MLTNEDLDQIAKVFGLDRLDSPQELPVRDGIVKRGEGIWWRYCTDPEWVIADGANWDNILEYPQLYSHAKPKTKLVYEG
jgi:hypothetical protein